MWEIRKLLLTVIPVFDPNAPVEVEFLSVVIVVSVTLAQFAVVIKVFQPDAAPNREILSPASNGWPPSKVNTAGFAFVAEDSAADFGRTSGRIITVELARRYVPFVAVTVVPSFEIRKNPS
tara:strand:- start:40 stop:402 length:363 start_codon:yes stop_codon:yes gene_type:complete